MPLRTTLAIGATLIALLAQAGGTENSDAATTAAGTAASTSASVSATATATATATVAAPAPAAACDVPRVERVTTQCAICHTFEKDEGHSVGPELHGVLGRKAASAPGFRYSKAFSGLDLEWTAAELDRFLAQPMTVVPGTTMAFAGLRDPADRAAIICKLKESQ